ncbi:MAG: hypothetical protein AAF799_12330 [Myxococcota bacterium]
MSESKPSPEQVLEALAVADRIDQAEAECPEPWQRVLEGHSSVEQARAQQADDEGVELDAELFAPPSTQRMAEIERMAVAAAMEPASAPAPATVAKVVPWRRRGARVLTHGVVAAAAAGVALTWQAQSPSPIASTPLSTAAGVEVQVGGTADRLGLGERTRVYRPGYELVLFIDADMDLPKDVVATVEATRTDTKSEMSVIGLGSAQRKSARAFELSTKIADQLSIGRWELVVQIGQPGACAGSGPCLRRRVHVEVAGAEAL